MIMKLNTIKPDEGAKKSALRVGRGHTRGKTCGRGHKGLKSRSGGKVSASFEGGQTPLQRRLPKTGFVAQSSLTHEEIALYQLASMMKKHDMKDPKITLATLKEKGLIRASTKTVKVILSGKLDASCHLIDVPATKGVKAHIKELGGSVTFTEEKAGV